MYFICIFWRVPLFFIFFFFNDTATTEIYTLSLHDALPISMPPEATWLGVTCFQWSPPSVVRKTLAQLKPLTLLPIAQPTLSVTMCRRSPSVRTTPVLTGLDDALMGVPAGVMFGLRPVLARVTKDKVNTKALMTRRTAAKGKKRFIRPRVPA